MELDKFRGGAQHHPCHLPRQQGRRKGTVYRGDVIYKWWVGVGVGGGEGALLCRGVVTERTRKGVGVGGGLCVVRGWKGQERMFCV